MRYFFWLLFVCHLCFAASEQLEAPVQTGIIQKFRSMHFSKCALLSCDDTLAWMVYRFPKKEPSWFDWWVGTKPIETDPRLDCNPLFWERQEEVHIFATKFMDSEAANAVNDKDLANATHVIYNRDRNEIAFARSISSFEMDHYEFWPLIIQIFPPQKLKTKLHDIIGYNQAKVKLKKIRDSYSLSKPYLKLGAKPPYGVFITGPTGTGKSLLAKALAGEMNRTLIRISGHAFLEDLMFSSARLSFLFDQARRHAPSMILIDGFDANKNLKNSLPHHLLLMQLKREMENAPKIHDIFIAMTIRDINTLDIEFLQQHCNCPVVNIDPPSKNERKVLIEQIAQNYVLADDCDFNVLSFQTLNFTPKDLQALFQEAANQAAHLARLEITQSDLEDASASIANTKAKLSVSKKNPAKLLAPTSDKVLFKDVGGCHEAKEELQEAVAFLKNPHLFAKIGAKMPKGILCCGPPGCGKTLLARAVAGEAGCNFYYCSGSDFIDKYVGRGAKNVSKLFADVKANTPAILFIDELDGIGAKRRNDSGGSHEYTNTLNQILAEIDGIEATSSLLVIAATNRPNSLDPALKRPGRFDRTVMIGAPYLKEREEILSIHLKGKPIDPSVDLKHTARMTTGMSGADLANMINEAALIAARDERESIFPRDLREACDKVQLGKERSSLKLTEEQKKHTAYHEVGHALVGVLLDSGWEVDKITIIPRGMALGITHSIPKGENVSVWMQEAKNLLAVKLGGLAAEKLFLGDGSSGVQNDLETASDLARTMVTKWGMSDRLGLATYDDDLSFETKRIIDMEVRDLLDTAYKQACDLLKEHEDHVHETVKQLLKKETLYRSDLDLILRS